MPKTRKQQQREQAARRERRERRIDQLIEMHQPPPKIRAADGKEYRPGDPQFGALLAQFTMTKALDHAHAIYGRAPSTPEIGRIYLGLRAGVPLTEVDAAVEKFGPATDIDSLMYDPRPHLLELLEKE